MNDTNPKKRRIPFALIVAGLVLLIPLIYGGSEHFRGQWMLRSYLRELAAEGEILDVDRLAPTHRPKPEDNGGLLLLKLKDQLKVLSDSIDRECVPPFGITRSGEIKDPIRMDHWKTDHGTKNWGHVAVAVALQSDLLYEIHLALNMPEFDLAVNYHGGLDQDRSFGAGFRYIHLLLEQEIIWQLHQGQREEALSSFIDLLRFIRGWESVYLVGHQKSRYPPFRSAWNLQAILLQEGDWSDTQLRAQQEAWHQLNLMNDMLRAHEMERAMMFDDFRRMQSSLSMQTTWLANLDPMLTSHFHAWGNEIFQHSLVFKWVVDHRLDGVLWNDVFELALLFQRCGSWSILWKDQDFARALKTQTQLLRYGRFLASTNWSSIINRGVVGKRLWDDEGPINQEFFFRNALDGIDSILDPGGPSTWIRFPFTDYVKCISYNYQPTLLLESKRQLVIAALACHRYRLAHGEWPPSLENLADFGLPTPPTDPLGGGNLVYRLDAERGFRLYSKGGNGIDDRGSDSGDDIYWPQASQ